MYDINWARSVYMAFRDSSPRAEQINTCIIYTSKGSVGYLDATKIHTLLIKSIQSKGKGQRLWTDYKRLVKRSPLDKDLLLSLTEKMQLEYGILRAEQQQLQLNIC